MITQTEVHELVEGYHTARVAGHETRYDRMCWSVRMFVKEHPDVKGIRAYKALEEALAQAERRTG